jgi:hypothetical protein
MTASTKREEMWGKVGREGASKVAPLWTGSSTAVSGNRRVNFGINQGANPDLDVKNADPGPGRATSPRTAISRPQRRRQVAALPLAAVQFDTAINMGVDEAKNLLAKSNGDVKTYLALREARYREIAKNPAKAKDLPTWLQRNADLSNFVSGGDIANKVREYSAFQDAVAHRQEAITKDPAAYVLGARPDISTQLSSKDPLVVQNGIRSMIAIQRDIGVPVPAVMSKPQVQAIVSAFNNPPDPEHRADTMLGIMGDLETRYGQYYPDVMRDLQKAGMPSEAIALAQVKNDPAVASRMALAVNAGRETLRKITLAPEDIDKEVNQSLSAYKRTLVGRLGAAHSIAQQQGAAQLYAYQLAQEGVSNPGQRSVSDIISKHYTFNSSYRVPTGIDPDAVENGARQLLRELPETAILPEGSLHDPRVTPETLQRISSQVLHGEGVWLTLPDDSGLYLAYPQNTGFIPGRLANGKTIQFSWGQLTGASGRNPMRDISNVK